MTSANRSRLSGLALLALCAHAASCELVQPSPFGAPCTSTKQCVAPLECHATEGLCLPPEEPAPLDTRGASCDEPMPLAFQQLGALAYGELATTLRASGERSDVCGGGPTATLSFEVPEQMGPDGAPRAGMVLRVHVAAAFPTTVALADEDCALTDPTHCGAADFLGAGELLLPAVPAGSHRLVVTAPGEDAQGGDIFVVVEQIACPYGFVPNGPGCLGFEEIGQVLPRSEHTVSALGGGEVAIIGGVDEAGEALDTMEIINGRIMATMPARTPIAGHAVARLASGPTLVFGGQAESPFDHDVLVLRRGNERPYLAELLTGSVDLTHPVGCRAAALPTVNEVLVVCHETRALVSAAIVVGGFTCNSDFDCNADELCVALYDDGEDAGGTCVCNRSDCYDEIELLSVTPLSDARVDIPTEGHVVLALSENTNRLLLVGGVAAGGARSHPYLYVAGTPGLQRGREELSALPALMNPAAVAVPGTVLLIGGTLEGAPSTAVALFDPTGTGAPIRLDMAVAREHTEAAALPDGRVLVIGGENAQGFVGTTEIIDPFVQTLEPGPLLPVAVAAARAVVSPQGTFVVGGRTAGGLSGAVWQLIDTPPALDAPPPRDLTRPMGDDCENATPIASGVTDGTTFDRFDQLDLAVDVDGCDQAYSSRGSEAVFSLEVPAGSALLAAASPRHEADVMLYALTECTPEVRTCIAYGDESPSATLAPEVLCVPPAATARSMFVVVDGFGTPQFDFVLDIDFPAACPP